MNEVFSKDVELQELTLQEQILQTSILKRKYELCLKAINSEGKKDKPYSAAYLYKVQAISLLIERGIPQHKAVEQLDAIARKVNDGR